MKRATKFYFHMIDGKRTGKPYSSKEDAEDWRKFVEGFHRQKSVITECPMILEDGKLTPETIKDLDERFNLDPPTEATEAALWKMATEIEG